MAVANINLVSACAGMLFYEQFTY